MVFFDIAKKNVIELTLALPINCNLGNDLGLAATQAHSLNPSSDYKRLSTS